NIRLYCLDSIDQESWYNRAVHPRQRVERHLAFEGYILDEVLPLAHAQGFPPGGRVAVTGASLGSFHAALLAFRQPQVVGKLVSMSGKFENSGFLDGYSDTLTYLTNPLAFLPNLGDPRYLGPLRSMEIDIVTGADDPHVNEDYRLSEILR